MKAQNMKTESHATAIQSDPELEALVSALEAKWIQKKAPVKRTRK